MDATSELYAGSYLACAALAAIGLVLRFRRKISDGEQLLSAALIAPLLALYFLGMHRVAGVDFENYYAAYHSPGDLAIQDPGYSGLTWLTREIGLDLPGFLFSQGILTITVLWYVARKRSADPVVVIVVYLLHLAIGRDLSTSRIGLAVVVYLLGQVQDRRLLKYALYLLAISFHLTVLIVMIGWSAACFVARQPPARRWLLGYIPILLLMLTGTKLLQLAAFVDPRVEIYLLWDEEGFGAPLASFAALGRSTVVIALLVAAQRRFRNLDLRVYILMELVGAAILIGLAEFSIFAARLSNVAISMYPVGLGIVAAAYQTTAMRRRTIDWGVLAKTSLVAMLVILLARPASLETLVRVVPSTFAAVQDAG